MARHRGKAPSCRSSPKSYSIRNIYTDEGAGTAANEAVSVVLALIVNPDTQWFPVVAALATLYQTYVQNSIGQALPFTAESCLGKISIRGGTTMSGRP